MTRLSLLVLAIVASLAPGCVEPGRTSVRLPVQGAGTGTRTFVVRDATVTLDDARIAWGPAYFCTTPFADFDLCPTALAEVTSVGTIDALDATPQALGTLSGIDGTVRSAMFDYGISWLLPAADPAPDPGAVDGRHSAHFAGTAERNGVRTRFVIDVDVVPSASGISAAHGVPVRHRLAARPDALTLRFDPEVLFGGSDFAELETLPGDPVVVPESSTLYQSVVIAFSSASTPTFEWMAVDEESP